MSYVLGYKFIHNLNVNLPGKLLVQSSHNIVGKNLPHI